MTWQENLLASLAFFVATIQAHFDAILHSGAPLFWWIRPRWNAEQIVDQYGKVILITGGNSGIGLSSARAFCAQGATVYIACRSKERAMDAIKLIKSGKVTGVEEIVEKALGTKHIRPPAGCRGRVEFIEMDLTDLESVDRGAQEFLRLEKKLDVLMTNAGIMATEPGQYTKQGFTLQFGTNVLGHQHLINLLLPLLQSTSKSNPTEPSRVITLSSSGHAGAPRGGVVYKSIIRDPAGNTNKRGKNELYPWAEYGQSKWANIAQAKYINWHYGPRSGNSDGEVLGIAVHPGFIATNLAKHLPGFKLFTGPLKFALPYLVVPPSYGSLNQLWAATCPVEEARKLSGQYIVPYLHVGRARPELSDRKKVEEVWNWCDEQIKKHV